MTPKVDMHKEKVARREIGSFTASKTLLRVHKIVPPAIPEQREKYSRKPIVYTILDDIGHGMKETNHQLSRSRTMSQRHGHPSVPTSPTVPAQGTLGRNFRTSGPVQPPVVPSGYSSPVTSAIDPPPLFRSNDTGGSNMFGSTPLPPPPPLPTHQPDGDGLPDPLPPAPMPPPPPPPPPTPQLPSDDLPPPPPQFSDSLLPPPPPMPPSDVLSSVCPPVPILPPLLPFTPQIPLTGFVARFQESITDCPPPPPPCDYMPDIDDCAPPPPPPVDYTDETPNSPTDYIEKVIAIYTYNKSKDDELSFQEGDVIYVTAKNEDGWYKGFSAGASGFFPGNYVQVTD
uniref:ABI gene family member 3 n=1 Tax=Callorhinchus milii TaxID=7868 RepID=A0A4W3HBK2_CALMI